MSYNFINEASTVRASQLCAHDTAVGYTSDFSENGNVDNWDYYTGIHTYGCWNGFLFGTLWRTEAYIGRYNVFNTVPAESHYFVKIAMKLNLSEASNASKGRIEWRTLSDPTWSSSKRYDFDLIANSDWNTYTINMGQEQFWQGDINDLRVYPIFDGRDGDEFFIRYIQITSVGTFSCINGSCDYFSQYAHPCAGVGERGSCSSVYSIEDSFSVETGVNDELLININGYGEEFVKIPAGSNISGEELAKRISKAISRLDIGGYSEASVSYEDGKFIIYSGTYHTNSSVVLSYSQLAEDLNFFNSSQVDISNKSIGAIPASGFKPQCSFRIKTNQLADIFDNSRRSYVYFDPSIYSIEGGRRDFLENGQGHAEITENETSGVGERDYSVVSNKAMTLIDFSHPFNASGRISKIYMACSQKFTDGTVGTNCKIKLFRPRRDGTYDYVSYVSVPNRPSGLYSRTSDYIVVDCDLWVNKGDVLGIYNLDVYVGKSLTGEVDAKYLQVSGDLTASINASILEGYGNTGFSIYARSDYKQDKLVLDIDLGNRYNLRNIEIYGDTISQQLEYNVARCLDINWQTDLFGGTHSVGYFNLNTGFNINYVYNNQAFGIDNLSDGVYIVENGLAADSYGTNSSIGIVPTSPKYFFINGDEEWLTTNLFTASYMADPWVDDFENDPIALYITFPRGRKKTIFKSSMYFKEQHNFRSFGLSYMADLLGISGNADDKRYTYIPEYTAVTLNGLRYYEGMSLYENVDSYLFANPNSGEPELESKENLTEGSSQEVLNFSEYLESVSIDWTIIEHEWEPIECYGFRVYCDYHKSTKITEMELYCRAEDVGSSLAAGISTTFSTYGDFWSMASTAQSTTDSAEAFIGDTPRYLTMEIFPLTNLKLRDIVFNVDAAAGNIGDKGCEYTEISTASKRGTTNQSKRVSIKNIYGRAYDLYVDIAKDSNKDDAAIFSSNLDSTEAVNNPTVGPDARYKKQEDYLLLGQNKNCAINSNCYALDNLMVGKSIYYKQAERLNWQLIYDDYQLEDVNLSNVSSIKETKFKIPVISRNRYWKFIYPYTHHELVLKEIRVFKAGAEVAATIYWYDGTTRHETPHLDTGSLTTSYYKITNTNYILIDLGAPGTIDEVVFYHNAQTGYVGINDTYKKYGVDSYCRYYLPGDSIAQENSYYEHNVAATGPGVSMDYWDAPTGKSSSILFDGVDTLRSPESSYLYLGQSSNPVYINSFSIELYVKFDELPALGQTTYFFRQNYSNTDSRIAFGYGLVNISGAFHLKVFLSNSVIDANYVWSVTTGGWHHLVFSVDGAGGNFREAVDGTIILAFGTTAQYTSVRGYGDFIVGQNLKGRMCNFRLTIGYNRSIGGSGVVVSFPTPKYIPYFSMELQASDDDLIYGVYEEIDSFGATAEGYYYDSDNDNSINGYTYFAVDLENRHVLDFIRNYGSSANVSLDNPAYLIYSNSVTDDADSVVFDSDKNDVRWLGIKLLNGDGTTRTIDKLGVYPSVTTSIAPEGSYNSSWTSLGSAITVYSDGENVALNATVSGSSQFGNLYLGRLVDGYLGTELNECWGSLTETAPWINIDLGEVKDIYRVKIYHGYDDQNTDYLVKDYTVQFSTDDSTYTTQFTITNNTSFERLHELVEAVPARWIKINITSYSAVTTVLRNEEGVFEPFAGAVLREVEIYEDYGYTLIDSEEHPVIAIDVKDQFYLAGLGYSENLCTGGYQINCGISSGDPDDVFDSYANTGWTHSGANEFHYIGYVFPTTYVFVRVRVYAPTRNYSVQFSNNGSTWVTLAKNTQVVWGQADVWYDHRFYNPTSVAYKYLRLVTDASYDSFSVKEIEAYTASNKDLIGATTTATNNWDASLNNFAYSDSVYGDPRKISFSSWGSNTYGDLIDGTQTYTAQYNSSIAYRAADGSLSTEWSTSTYALNQWWKVDFGEGVAHAVNYINTYNGANRNRGIRLEASNDDSNWTILTYLSIPTSGGWIASSFSNTTAYRYYRLVFYLQWYGNGPILIEVEMSSNYIPEPLTERIYAQWLLVKNNNATNVNGGANYLKHVVLSTETAQNPFEYSWWWYSNLSTLENDPSTVVTGLKSLKINYPTSSGVDNVHLVEGDTFGTDSLASWRDGLDFKLYISDIDKLDTGYGYIYFGNQTDDVEYRWNMATLYDAGALNTGWNYLFLRFKAAEIIYSIPEDPNADDPRIISNLELKSFGLFYRGVGEAFYMNLDSIRIKRNDFLDYTILNYGLYITGSEYLVTNLGQFDMTKGTIEFFMRPDYRASGYDEYGIVKQRSLFSFINVANDMLGAFIYGDDINIYFGNLNDSLKLFQIASNDYWSIDQAFHFALVHSSSGKDIDSYGSTLKLFLNGTEVSRIQDTWEVNDTKYFSFVLGGGIPYGISKDSSARVSSCDAVVSNLKIYNYCKTDFDESLNKADIDVEILTKPSEMIEISGDNLTFYKVDSGQLPLVFKNVPAGDTAHIYIRSNLPSTLTGKESRTSAIVASWEVGV